MKPKADYYFGPTKLPSGERVYYERILHILDGLLNDLKNEGCLRRASSSETIKFVEIMKDKNEISLAFNRLQDLFSTPAKFQNFMERNKEHFGDEDLSYLLISQLYFLSLVHAEMFRNLLLFYLKRGRGENFYDKMTLGKFLQKLKEISPIFGEKLETELESIIRNSFAHGLFNIKAITGTEPQLFCYESVGNLENPTRFSLTDLMIKRKNFNMVFRFWKICNLSMV